MLLELKPLLPNVARHQTFRKTRQKGSNPVDPARENALSEPSECRGFLERPNALLSVTGSRHRAGVRRPAEKDPRLLDEWIGQWSDIVDFDVHCVMTSDEAAETIAPRL
jgi:hypothetical protein